MAQQAKQRSWGLIVTVALVLAGIGGLAVFKTMTKPADTQAAFTTQFDSETRKKLKDIHEAIGKYLSENDLPKARIIAEQLVKEYPGNQRGHEMLAEILTRQNRFDEAYIAAGNALKLNPNSDELHFLCGILASKRGDLEKAKYHHTQARILAPTSAKYAMYMGDVLIKLNELDDAQLQLLAALKLDSNLPQVHGMLADISARRGKLTMAVEQINKAVELVSPGDPKRPAYVMQKATYLRRANFPEQALEVLATIPPNRLDAVSADQFAQTYMMMSRPVDAAEAWVDQFNREPKSAHAAAEAGRYYLKAKDLTKARQYLAFAKRINPNHPTVLLLAEEMGRD